jgi:putative flippase GtrA
MFLVAGGVGFGVDVGIATCLLKTKKVPLLIANSFGFIIGVIVKYIINRICTFNSDDPNILAQFGKFMLISLVGLVMVNYIVYYLHTQKQKKFMFSKIMAMLVFMVWNFTANYFFTFNR